MHYTLKSHVELSTSKTSCTFSGHTQGTRFVDVVSTVMGL